MPDEVDPHLLERFVQGDQTAFEALFRQFQPDVYCWILRITRDPGSAEDALVEAFWRAYRSRARFDASRSFGAWMRRIATNAALDQLRAARARAHRYRQVARLPCDTVVERGTGQPGVQAMTDDTQLAALLRSAIPAMVTRQPSRDLWPRIASRAEQRLTRSWIDIGLAARVSPCRCFRWGWPSTTSPGSSA